MATVTKGGTLPDTGVTKDQVYALVDNATLSAVVNADIASNAAIADSKLAPIATAGKVNTSALDTTSKAAGDVLYNDGTNWVRLAKDAGKALVSGASAVSWGYPTGSVVQVVNVQTGAVATGTTAIPDDDTIPTYAEGDEYMTLAITPKSASNKLRVDVIGISGHSGGGTQIMALFRDGTGTDAAKAAVRSYLESAGSYNVLTLTYYVSAGSTSATTFNVRIGNPNGATTTFNGTGGARKLGGVLASSITITEIQG